MQAYGGTEIQVDYLHKYVPYKFLDKVQVTTSIPEKEPLHPMKPNILWLKNSYDQPNVNPWFQKKSNHKKYDYYVFNSHWSYEKYRYAFDIPHNRCLVIKNGIDYDELVIKEELDINPPLKIVYLSTPWRGLDVLLGAMEILKKEKDIVLDVFSSTQIYGDAFKKANDNHYAELYKKAKALPNVNYKGYYDHKALLKELPKYHVNCHPSTWEETFCISAMESLAAGLIVITTDLGALPETCAEFPVYMPYNKDKKELTQLTANTILDCKNHIFNLKVGNEIKFQQDYYRKFYDWKQIGTYWTNFLKGAIYEYEKKRQKN